MYKLAHNGIQSRNAKCLDKAKPSWPGVRLTQFIHASDIYREVLCARAVLPAEKEPWARQPALRKPAF